MAYTPINWQTGDTITAEKMNLMDNGWGVGTAQLFSETVTTEDTGDGFSDGSLTYASPINAEIINVTFDSNVYTCPRIDFGGDSFYGGFDSGPDFSTYPFMIYSAADGGGNSLATQTAGTHTVAVSAETVEVSSNFNSAVNKCVDTSAMPMLCVSGVTTASEIETAIFHQKRLLYFMANNTNALFLILQVQFTTDTDAIVTFYPEYSGVSASVTNGIFTVTEQ